ncbi:hypothetical protein HYV74_04500 [Candidatus Uhrbacteria bacterium]|nr:hypothetical protein [Candidatus Uhrbacteria bacterium]
MGTIKHRKLVVQLRREDEAAIAAVRRRFGISSDTAALRSGLQLLRVLGEYHEGDGPVLSVTVMHCGKPKTFDYAT